MNTSRKLATFITMTGMLALSGCFKATGGGWFVDEGDGDLVTFGFNAQPVGEPTGECDGFPFPFPDIPTCQAAKGRMTIIDHGSVSGEPHMIRATFTGTFNPSGGNPGDGSQFTGTAIVDGEEWMIGMRVSDYGEGGLVDDFIFVMLEPVATADGNPDLVYVGTIGNGNIQVHARN